MREFEDAYVLLEELSTKIDEITALVNQKEKECQDNIQNKQQYENELEEIISEKAELEEILNHCSVDVCQYKLVFEEIRKRHTAQIQDMVSDQSFHFFLSFRGEYYAGSDKGVIEAHKEIIDRDGYCWWGKFSKKRVRGGEYEELEPFGESIGFDGESSVAHQLRDKVIQRIAKRDNIYLYNYNPNPPDISLFVCNVIDVFYGREKIPYEDEEIIPPECARTPKYYYYKREKNCITCQKIDPTKCKPEFYCNFWFKIDDIVEIKDVEKSFLNLENCFTQDSINFAIPILYPLIVRQREEIDYFPDKAELIPCPEDFTFEIPTDEEGHTKAEKVKNFFGDLNRHCGMVFRRVGAMKGARFPDKYKIHKSSKNDEIPIILPSDYRRDGRPSRYVIYLHESTNQSQKMKVEALIEGFLK